MPERPLHQSGVICGRFTDPPHYLGELGAGKDRYLEGRKMANHSISESQHIAAKVAGFTYLFTDLTAIFAELYVRAHLIVHGNPAQTAANILAHQRLFRVGILCELITFGGIILLAVAFYVVLKPVNPGLALLGAFWRLAENIILAVMTFSSFQVLGLLTNPYYVSTFGADRLQALMRLSLNAHGDAYNVGLIFAGLGTAVFAYLFLRSHYIPRILAAWGVFSSLLVAAHTLAVIVFPAVSEMLEPWVFLPLLGFEIGTGLWLLVKGLPASATA
jgi:hypothetical protein